jgi:hypothetical protein
MALWHMTGTGIVPFINSECFGATDILIFVCGGIRMRIGSTTAFLAALGMGGLAQAAVLTVGLTAGPGIVLTCGTCSDSQDPGIEQYVFNNQPATTPTAGSWTNPNEGSGYGVWWGTGDRAACFDFGTNYQNVTINGTFEQLRAWGVNPTTPLSFWWSPTKSKTFDASAGCVPAPAFGFEDPAVMVAGDKWVQGWSGSVTPQAEYLIMYMPGTTNTGGQRSCQFVFDGTVGAVPEPAALSMLGLTGLAMLRRRRA